MREKYVREGKGLNPAPGSGEQKKGLDIGLVFHFYLIRTSLAT